MDFLSLPSDQVCSHVLSPGSRRGHWDWKRSIHSLDVEQGGELGVKVVTHPTHPSKVSHSEDHVWLSSKVGKFINL